MLPRLQQRQHLLLTQLSHLTLFGFNQLVTWIFTDHDVVRIRARHFVNLPARFAHIVSKLFLRIFKLPQILFKICQVQLRVNSLTYTVAVISHISLGTVRQHARIRAYGIFTLWLKQKPFSSAAKTYG